MNPTAILIKAALVLAMLSTPAQASYPPPRGCAQVLPRKEWRTLTPQEESQYFEGMNKVVRSTYYSQLSRTHDEHNSYIHGWSLFFPWHRAFLMQLELEMQKTLNDPTFRLPYWNWSLDSQSPEQAPIWGSGANKLGTGGRDGSCVRDGAFADYAPKYPAGRDCLQREWARSGGRRMDPVTSPDVLNRIISTSRNYDEFRRGIEMSPHGGVHVSIGGDMAYMHSPNDPAFFLHHAMVDKIWADYQQLPGNSERYDGTQGDFRGARGPRGSSRSARTNDPLTPYNDWTVQNTFDTRSLCYFYGELNFNSIAQPNLPPPTVVRPTAPVTQPVIQPVSQPVTQPIRPSQPTQPVRPSQPTQPVRPSQPTQPVRPTEPRREEREHTSKKIKKFFKDLFNDGALDPSQTPIGAGGKAPEPAPVDDKVKMDFIDAPVQLLPTDPKQVIAQEKQINAQLYKLAEDRSELVKLRPQPLIPAAWYEKNGHNVEEARAKEAEYTNTVIQLNQVFGYISPSALWNQVTKVADLAAKDVKEFSATLSKVVVNVENTIKKDAQNLETAAKQAAVDVYARVKQSIGLVSIQNIEKVTSIVKNLIGDSVYSKDELTNPYRPRHAHKQGNSSSSSSSSSSE